MATNREIFEEAFGYDAGGCPFYCSDVEPCPFFEENRSCRTEEFWEMDNDAWKKFVKENKNVDKDAKQTKNS